MENKITVDNIKDPQIYISNEADKLFDNIKHYKEFRQLDNKDFFMLALMFGYLNKKRSPLKKQNRTKSGFTRERYLSENDKAVLKTIAIEETGQIEVVNKIMEVFSIAEEFANGGIIYLQKFIFDNPADFAKKFASTLKKLSV